RPRRRSQTQRYGYPTGCVGAKDSMLPLETRGSGGDRRTAADSVAGFGFDRPVFGIEVGRDDRLKRIADRSIGKDTSPHATGDNVFCMVGRSKKGIGIKQ